MSLIGDEGIEALAVQGILEHGLPKVESGLIYGRFPLYLYTQAILAHFFEVGAYWLRLPSVIWGVAAILPAYVLGRDLFNRPVGVLTAIVLAFSVWEIELSRYARGYTAFQFFFLVSLIFFYHGFMLDKGRHKLWFMASSAFTFLTHALSDLLLMLFAIPFFSAAFTWRRKLTFGVWGMGLAGMIVIRRKSTGIQLPEGSGLSFPVSEEQATGLLGQIRRSVGLPPLDLPDMSYFQQTLQQEPILIAAFAVVASIATLFLIYQYAQGQRGWLVLTGMLMVWAAVAYQFGVAFICLALYLIMLSHDDQRELGWSLLVSLGAVFTCFVGWTAVLVANASLSLVEVPLALFGFPNLYGFFFSWLVEGWPVMTVFLMVGSIWLFMRFLWNPKEPVPIFLLGALYITAVAGSLFESYHSSRYIFHLYPLVVIIFVWSTIKIGVWVWKSIGYESYYIKGTAVLVGVFTLLVISQDANPWRSWAVGERTYQSSRDPARSVISWWPYADFHQDFQGPSSFVKERLTEQDKVLVVGVSHMASLYYYYIGRTDYIQVPSDDPNDSALVKGGESLHYMTGSDFSVGVEGLKKMLQKHEGNLWILGDRRILMKENQYYSDELVEYLNSITQQEDYVGRDGITFAVKV